MRALAALLLAVIAATSAAACDYPGPPPGSGEARAEGRGITWAGFSDATTRYGHGVLGDAVEAGGLRAMTRMRGPCDLSVILPEDRVFEDFAPRLADLDGDGRPEIIVVETQVNQGGSLAVYGLRLGRLQKIAATPHIGRSNRWLAPVGAADLDGDGHMEIAYVDRPHLARVLMIWRFRDGELEKVAELPGLTNHRIGDDRILGGIRDCGDGPEMITATPDWRGLVATRFRGGKFETRHIGPNTPEAEQAALACR
ncbi:MAG: VCBS repeat-containing protein [Rhodobacteraceae bacterium]|nr:VCBS repeat-containing protein [Paracoccaceae bacterium]